MIICDSSPLISFSILNRVDLLDHIFNKVCVPEAVYKELVRAGKPYCEELQSYLYHKVKVVQNDVAVSVLKCDLGAGESEVIVLAKELSAQFILIDDQKARRIAELNELPVIGTLGVLLRAKRLGLVDEIRPLLEQLEQAGIRIGSKLIDMILAAAQESH